jgi:hypothetical protein
MKKVLEWLLYVIIVNLALWLNIWQFIELDTALIVISLFSCTFILLKSIKV